MKIRAILCAALASAMLATGAMAQDMIRAQDPSTVTGFMFDEGIPTKTDVDNVGDPVVMFRKGDHPYVIMFYDCVENRECKSLRFYSGFETNGKVDVAFANMLNNENRFATALIDDEDDLVLIMDVLTGDNGLTTKDFKNLLDLFIALIDDARTQMN